MAAQMYNDDTKPTHGVGNAGGKPIRPILFGVAAVIALILISLAFSNRSNQVGQQANVSRPRTQDQSSQQYNSATNASRTAQGGNANSRTDAYPAIAPNSNSTSVSGSSSLPTQSAGQNIVAPPGPAANQQGTN